MSSTKANSVSSTRGLLMPIRGVSFAELQHAGYQPVELLETERLGCAWLCDVTEFNFGTNMNSPKVDIHIISIINNQYHIIIYLFYIIL